MAYTDTYIDPLNGDDGTGDGTKGSPYKTTQFALDNTTRDATNGDRFNVQDTAADVFTAAMSFVTYGTPTLTAPLLIQGYTTDEDDGGIGTLDAGGIGATFIFATGVSKEHIHLLDLKIVNGLGVAVAMADDSLCFNVWIDDFNSTSIQMNGGSGIIQCSSSNSLQGFATVQGTGVQLMNYQNHGTRNMTFLADFSPSAAGHGIVFGSIQWQDNYAFAEGVEMGDGTVILNNTLFCEAGINPAIRNVALRQCNAIANNIIEGYSGVGGVGFDILITGSFWHEIGANAFFNNETDTDTAGDDWYDAGDNESLGASALTDPTSGNFIPTDQGNVKEGTLYPDRGLNGLIAVDKMWKGAIRPQDLPPNPYYHAGVNVNLRR